MNWELIWMILRYVLIAGGSTLVAKGHITDAGLQEIVGGIGVMGATAWGLYVKYGTRAVQVDDAKKKSVTVVSQATGQEVHP
jgi:hypothetical protein